MKPLVILVGIVLSVAFIKAIVNTFKDTRDDALKQGHGLAASNARGFAYIAMGIGGIVLFAFLLINVDTIGLGWALVIIFLFFGVGWSLLGDWMFNKKQNLDQEKGRTRQE